MITSFAFDIHFNDAMLYLLIVKRCELYGFSAMQTKYIIIIEVNDFFTHF